MKKQNWGRPPKGRLKNTARVGDINIIDEFSSQKGGQGAPPERDKTPSPAACAPTPDMVLLTEQMSNTEFSTFLGKAGSEANQQIFPWWGPEELTKLTDIVKRKAFEL